MDLPSAHAVAKLFGRHGRERFERWKRQRSTKSLKPRILAVVREISDILDRFQSAYKDHKLSVPSITTWTFETAAEFCYDIGAVVAHTTSLPKLVYGTKESIADRQLRHLANTLQSELAKYTKGYQPYLSRKLHFDRIMTTTNCSYITSMHFLGDNLWVVAWQEYLIPLNSKAESISDGFCIRNADENEYVVLLTSDPDIDHVLVVVVHCPLNDPKTKFVYYSTVSEEKKERYAPHIRSPAIRICISDGEIFLISSGDDQDVSIRVLCAQTLQQIRQFQLWDSEDAEIPRHITDIMVHNDRVCVSTDSGMYTCDRQGNNALYQPRQYIMPTLCVPPRDNERRRQPMKSHLNGTYDFVLDANEVTCCVSPGGEIWTQGTDDELWIFSSSRFVTFMCGTLDECSVLWHAQLQRLWEPGLLLLVLRYAGEIKGSYRKRKRL